MFNTVLVLSTKHSEMMRLDFLDQIRSKDQLHLMFTAFFLQNHYAFIELFLLAQCFKIFLKLQWYENQIKYSVKVNFGPLYMTILKCDICQKSKFWSNWRKWFALLMSQKGWVVIIWIQWLVLTLFQFISRP